MLCLDRTLLCFSLAVLAPSACSDDGLAPPAETDASTSGIATGEQGSGSTSAVTGNPGTGTATGGPSDGGTDGSPSDTGGTGPADGSDTGTTGEPPSMTCEDDEQCVLVDNCCDCAAYHVGDEVPACDMECVQTMCSSLGIAGIGVVCEDGTCGLERRDCSGVVTCDSPEPICPEGTLPEVGPRGGGCWTGACIPEEACDPVPSCDYCDETETCVTTETQLGSMVSCRAIPEDCAGVPTCECMPPETCEPPFDTCVDMDGQITCTCPAC